MRLGRATLRDADTQTGDLQHGADRLDPKGIAMLVDEIPQDLSRRSSSAWAKSAGQLQYLVGPAQFLDLALQILEPLRLAGSDAFAHASMSTSNRLTHSCSVCGTQPILGAIDSMAAHSDG